MQWPRRGAVWLAWGLALVLVCGAGCGESEEPVMTGTRMGAPLAPDASVLTNRPPQIESLRLKPRAPRSGDYVEAVARATDPDGDKAWVLYEWTLDGVMASGKNNRLPLQVARKGTQIEVRAIPTDGRSKGDAVRASAKIENAPPEVTSAEYDLLPPVQRGQTIGIAATADDSDLEDRDNLKFRYRWYVNGIATGNRERSFNTSALRSGDSIHVRVVAHDGDDPSKPFDTLPVVLGNLPPEIVSTPEAAVSTDGSFRYALEAHDPDGDRGLRFELVKGPEGMSLDTVLGELHWTPKEGQVGEHMVEVHVIDSKGGKDGQVFPITVSEPAGEDEQQAPASPGD